MVRLSVVSPRSDQSQPGNDDMRARLIVLDNVNARAFGFSRLHVGTISHRFASVNQKPSINIKIQDK
jgi:hypothetical protein